MSVHSEREISTRLAKENKTSTQDVFCNVASERPYVQWCVVLSLFATKSKIFPILRKAWGASCFLSILYINRLMQFALIQTFLGLPVPLISSGQLCSSSLLTCGFAIDKRMLGSSISTCWWGRCLCHPTHPASSAVTESCKHKMSPTVSSDTSLSVIWP